MFDDTSPDYPDAEESPHDRDRSTTRCLSMPTEGENVIGVTSVAPSKRKAYYSDYGVEQADVSAPGGDTPRRQRGDAEPGERGALAVPGGRAREAEGLLDEAGNPTAAARRRRSARRRSARYYRYLQGTSMASPHAAGVAALAVAQFGTPDGKGGVGLAPRRSSGCSSGTATDTPCPAQNPFVYTNLPAPGPAGALRGHAAAQRLLR